MESICKNNRIHLSTVAPIIADIYDGSVCRNFSDLMKQSKVAPILKSGSKTIYLIFYLII